MEPFRIHHGLVVPLDRINVDTDQMVPKQFLKRIERTGFGDVLFYDWRYLEDGTPNPDFMLNNPAFKGASILLARDNFGCGSSREHAVWAVADYGIRAILAPSFADIFYQNCCNNGILPVTLPRGETDTLFARAGACLNDKQPPLELTVDLEHCTVSDGRGWGTQFGMDEYHREMLLSGLDPIGATLQQEQRIDEFESRLPTYLKARILQV